MTRYQKGALLRRRERRRRTSERKRASREREGGEGDERESFSPFSYASLM
jgi:hypothetical protein